jgi:hypothetical protein
MYPELRPGHVLTVEKSENNAIPRINSTKNFALKQVVATIHLLRMSMIMQ